MAALERDNFLGSLPTNERPPSLSNEVPTSSSESQSLSATPVDSASGHSHSNSQLVNPQVDSATLVPDKLTSTTILSLPPELVSVILSSCTNPSLLVLAQTCINLHAIALNTFFERNKVLDPANQWLVGYQVPRETLDAVRMALFVKRMVAMHWYFNAGWNSDDNGDEEEGSDCPRSVPEPELDSKDRNADKRMGPLKRTFHEINNMRLIFARLPAVKLVKLHFTVVDPWLEADTRSRMWMKDKVDYNVDAQLWKSTFTGLLDAVLDGGCEELYVIGGGIMKDLFWCKDPKGEAEAEKASAVTSRLRDALQADARVSKKLAPGSLSLPFKFKFRPLLGFVNKLFTSGKRQPDEQPNKHNHDINANESESPRQLKQLYIHSDLLLVPPFFDWTLGLLGASISPSHSSGSPSFKFPPNTNTLTSANALGTSSTLTHLSFKPHTMPIPTALLLALDLPSLVEFEITTNTVIGFPVIAGYGFAKFEEVAAFLGRHNERLERVALYGVGLPPWQPSSLGEATISPLASISKFSDKRRPIFPRLKNVFAHPAYIVWLLGLATSCAEDNSSYSPFWNGWKTRRHRDSAATTTTSAPASSSNYVPTLKFTLANLESISITAEYYAREPTFDYALFDDALRAVARFCRWRNKRDRCGNGLREFGSFGFGKKKATSKNTWGKVQERQDEKEKEGGTAEAAKETVLCFAKHKTIELILRFASQAGVYEWFASHLSQATDSKSALGSMSVLTELTQVSTLTISGSYFIQLEREVLDLLPEWFALLGSGSGSIPSMSSSVWTPTPQKRSTQRPSSNLRKVRFIELADPQHLLVAENFVRRVAEQCLPLGLRWIEVKDVNLVFDLEEIQVGGWDGSRLGEVLRGGVNGRRGRGRGRVRGL